jgi:hypothetical protein
VAARLQIGLFLASCQTNCFSCFFIRRRTYCQESNVATTSGNHFTAFDIGRRAFAGVEYLEVCQSGDYSFVAMRIWNLRGRPGHLVTSPSFLDSERGDENVGQNREIFRPIVASAGRNILRIG